MKRLLASMMLLVTAGCMMLGCEPMGKSEIKTYGLLRYYYHYDYENITILELVAEVLTLEIPLKIDGAPVTIIGGSRAGKTYSIESKFLKKVHIPYSIVSINYAFENSPAIEDIIVEKCDEVFSGLNLNQFKSNSMKKNVYVSNLMFNEYKDFYITTMDFGYWLTINIANTTFWYNHTGSPNKGIFSLDNVEAPQKPRPPMYAPEWEGHIFAGWYADRECTQPYDFTAENEPAEEYNFYAGWKKVDSENE